MKKTKWYRETYRRWFGLAALSATVLAGVGITLLQLPVFGVTLWHNATVIGAMCLGFSFATFGYSCGILDADRHEGRHCGDMGLDITQSHK